MQKNREGSFSWKRRQQEDFSFLIITKTSVLLKDLTSHLIDFYLLKKDILIIYPVT